MTERPEKRTIAAGAVGNVLEWYDFGVYAFLATILAKDYFPTGDPRTALIATFGVFAGGYLMRPIGAVLLGHIGDRFSRRAALMVSVLGMTIATGAIAILPTYETIGIAAPILLTALRLLQGLSVGGETTGAVVLLVETAPRKRRALIGVIAMVSGILGMLLASAASALLANLISPEGFADGAWRWLYAPAPLLGVIGFLLRRRLANDPTASAERERRLPVIALLRHHGPALIRVAGLAGMLAIANYMVFIYGATYLTTIGDLPRAQALTLTTIGNVCLILFQLGWATLVDRIGPRPVMTIGAVGLLFVSFPLFSLFRTGDPAVVMAALVGFAVFVAAVGSGLAVVMCGLFPRGVRYTGVSLGYGLSFGILGGTTPLIATSLIDVTGNDLSPILYLMVAPIIGMAALLLTPTRTINLDR